AGDNLPAGPAAQAFRPQPGGRDRTSTQPGTVEPAQQAHLVAAVPGVLRKVDVDIGDRVKRGQGLAEIGGPALALEERQAGVGLEQAQGLLKEAEARVAAAGAEVEAAKGAVKQREVEAAVTQANLAYRKKQLDRLKDLSKEKAVDSRLVDEAEEH